MSDDRENVFSRLRSRSEEVLTQLTGELMSNPQFARAVQQALKGKQFLDDAAERALKRASIPTRTEFRRAVARVETLESEVAELRGRLDRAEKAARPAKKPARGRKKTATKKAGSRASR